LPQTCTLPMVRVLSGTAHAPPGWTDAVLLSLGWTHRSPYDSMEHDS
jgi:hypothetical protein